MKTGTLSVVATPIGNMEDITLRAIRVLREADYVLCEDTRVTGKLLKYHGIEAKLKRYDAHTSEKTHIDIVNDIKNGLQVALVSDAGTPGVSDPGVHLIQCVQHSVLDTNVEVRVEAIPGASAVTAAFSIAGLSGNKFTFLGFVPQKKGRQTFFASLSTYNHPVIFFESTHRIMKTLTALQDLSLDKPVIIGRELTKLHEEVIVGRPDEILKQLTDNPVRQKGEFVVIVEETKNQ